MVNQTLTPPRRVLVPQAISPRAPALGGALHSLAGRTMGTTWSLRFVGSRGAPLPAIDQAVQSELERVVAQMSSWEPDSDISRFNRAAAGSWQRVPSEFFEVLSCALQIARDSDGAFDPAAGALIDAWGFGSTNRHGATGFLPPSPQQVEQARQPGGWRRLEVDAREHRVRQPGGLRLDFSAIAKGYAVDRVAHRLSQSFGLDDTLVEIGGELRGSGLRADGQPWWVALEMPPGSGELRPTVVALHGLCLATSGDYRRFHEHDGERHPHTLDPRSGRPIAHGLASVTVLHASCMAADALSTALTVLGPDSGFDWAESRGLAAMFVARRGGQLHERLTRAFAALA